MITCTAVWQMPALCVFLMHSLVKEVCSTGGEALGRVTSSQCYTGNPGELWNILLSTRIHEYNIIAWCLAPLLQLINTVKHLFHFSLLQRNETWSVLSEEPGCNWVIYFASRGISPLINEMSKAAKSCKDHTLRVINHEQSSEAFWDKKCGWANRWSPTIRRCFVSFVFKEVFFSFN